MTTWTFLGNFCCEGHLPAILIEPEIIGLMKCENGFSLRYTLPIFCFLYHPSSIASCQDPSVILGNVGDVVLHHPICGEQVWIPLVDTIISAVDNFHFIATFTLLKTVNSFLAQKIDITNEYQLLHSMNLPRIWLWRSRLPRREWWTSTFLLSVISTSTKSWTPCAC